MIHNRFILVVVLAIGHLNTCLAQYERRVASRDFYDYYNHANYDEALVPDYTLPDIMQCLDGTVVGDVKTWEEKRRPELLRLFTSFMYGKQPLPDSTFSFERMGKDRKVLNGRAMRRDMMLHLTGEGPDVQLSLVWANDRNRLPRKTMMGISFIPNDSIFTFYPNGKRPKGAEAWNIDSLFAHGYALATFCYTEAETDKAKDLFKSSRLHRHFYQKGQHYPLPDEWGAIACCPCPAGRWMRSVLLPPTSWTCSRWASWGTRDWARRPCGQVPPTGASPPWCRSTLAVAVLPCRAAVWAKPWSVSTNGVIIGFAAISGSIVTVKSGCPLTSTNCWHSSRQGDWWSSAARKTIGPTPRARASVAKRPKPHIGSTASLNKSTTCCAKGLTR